jgi:hypothetical protein
MRMRMSASSLLLLCCSFPVPVLSPSPLALALALDCTGGGGYQPTRTSSGQLWFDLSFPTWLPTQVPAYSPVDVGRHVERSVKEGGGGPGRPVAAVQPCSPGT